MWPIIVGIMVDVRDQVTVISFSTFVLSFSIFHNLWKFYFILCHITCHISCMLIIQSTFEASISISFGLSASNAYMYKMF